ncbi:hypothetical protein [Halalkalicoccus jeotgali]|uniref:Uncharacterized protein n=1 Tax=Halalkalicoccus jeotgali (strain DSM 18796 / CECT 7217 / JCM 14584 / KCTC 4019 / B3) TaxID=795797 RepID=D8J8E8_HALJB|nr:hypothetical protein [Halalkalicoccus jeotgali]ADJ16194.1 hypothetical protein HacjB3_14065 [Halalkalicoccus jeotgali B3]ELY37622.1 hypothetical protein C497_09283 [Halalkalicoccus jeotgali B3]
MDVLVAAGSFSPVELGLLALIVITLVLPVVLALALERFVYKGRVADPVGFAELENRFDNGKMWAERLREDRED